MSGSDSRGIAGFGCTMMMLRRRSFLAACAATPLLAHPALGLRRAIAARRPARFDRHAQRTISAVIDRMLPRDELPGAVDLDIDRRLGAMAELPPRQPLADLHRSLAEAAAWLDKRARAAGGIDFLGLDAVRQDAVLLSAQTSRDEAASTIVWTLRDRAFALYYSHPTIVGAFRYAGAPQPTGFPDFEDAPG